MVEKVTVLNVSPLFKNGEPANSIELLEFAEVGYRVVRQKGLNKVGEEVLLVHPDWCIPNKALFTDFYAPGGDPKKSKLGSNGRIKAIKFNFTTQDSLESVMSYGLILDKQDLTQLGVNKSLEQITDEDLGITKYEVPDKNSGSSIKSIGGKERPSWLYKTDEPNFYNVCRRLDFPIRLTGTLKIDGSSISICAKDYVDGQKGFIMSRQIIQPNFTTYKAYFKPTLIQCIKRFFGFTIHNYMVISQPSDSDYVKYGLPILSKITQEYDNICVRGEIVGGGFKGSGNSKNPHKELIPQIFVYGIDVLENGVFRKIGKENTDFICERYSLQQVPVVFDDVEFQSATDLENQCKEYFKTHMVEGIVFRNSDSSISFKYMNLEYDAKN